MAYDALLADRLRATLAPRSDLVELRMFGGLGFTLHGNMACGVAKDELIARLGPEGSEEAIRHAGVREFDFTGRPMRGWVMVERPAWEPEGALEGWVDRALAFAETLPAKKK